MFCSRTQYGFPSGYDGSNPGLLTPSLMLFHRAIGLHHSDLWKVVLRQIFESNSFTLISSQLVVLSLVDCLWITNFRSELRFGAGK